MNAFLESQTILKKKKTFLKDGKGNPSPQVVSLKRESADLSPLILNSCREFLNSHPCEAFIDTAQKCDGGGRARLSWSGSNT